MPAKTAEPVRQSKSSLLREEVAELPFIVEGSGVGAMPLMLRGAVDQEQYVPGTTQVLKGEYHPWLEFDRHSCQMVIPRNDKPFKFHANRHAMPASEVIRQIEEKLALHESGEDPDPRLDAKQIRVTVAGHVGQPFGNWDRLAADQLADMVANMLEGDDVKDARFVENCIRFELQRGDRKLDGEQLAVREDVLEMLDLVAENVPDEDADTATEGL